MELVEGILKITNPMGDEDVQMLDSTLSQEGVEGVVIQTADLGPAIIQRLLRASKHINIEAEDEFTQKLISSVYDNENPACD